MAPSDERLTIDTKFLRSLPDTFWPSLCCKLDIEEKYAIASEGEVLVIVHDKIFNHFFETYGKDHLGDMSQV